MLIMFLEIRILLKRKIQKIMILDLRREAMAVVIKKRKVVTVMVVAMVLRKEAMVVMAVDEVVDEALVDQEVVDHQKERAVTLVMITLLEVVIII